MAAGACTQSAHSTPNAAVQTPPDSSSTPPSPEDPNATGNGANVLSPIGVNVSPLAEYGTEVVFLDAMKDSSRWISQDVPHNRWDNGMPIDVDSDGWVRSLQPGQAAAKTMMWAIGAHYPGGVYTVLYDGDGQFEFRYGAILPGSAPGRLLVQVDPTVGGIWLRLIATNPANPARHIRMILPGYEPVSGTQTFYPNFLQRWKQARILRFMDWGLTNASPTGDWRLRTTPARDTQSNEGGPVAYEYMIQLANELHADPWICVPHLADDDYVTRLARLVSTALDPGLRCFVEHSNEVWNGSFPQCAYAQSRGLALQLSTNQYQAGTRYHALRSREIFDIFTSEMGQGRVVRVLGAWMANPSVGDDELSQPGVAAATDALAVAPYFGYSLGLPANVNATLAGGLNGIFQSCGAEIAGMPQTIAAQVTIAANHGVQLIAYEGGQGLVGIAAAQSNTQLTSLFESANRDPRMQSLYGSLLSAWRSAGGHYFVAYDSMRKFTQYGSWGLMEYDDSDPAASPKFEAVNLFATNNPRWW